MGVTYEIAVGLKKGHKVTKLEKRQRPSQMRRVNKRVKFVRDLVKEVCGLAPYEKRIIELLKVSKDKRALKLAKKRLGGHSRGKRKREEMQAVIQLQRKLQAQK
jgi:large subunit ribosomal protein L36e